jgi:hypothetical protein
VELQKFLNDEISTSTFHRAIAEDRPHVARCVKRQTPPIHVDSDSACGRGCLILNNRDARKGAGCAAGVRRIDLPSR